MTENIILIILGIVSTAALAFASYDSDSKHVKRLFYASLVISLGIIVYQGSDGIRKDREITALKRKVTENEPFRIRDEDRKALDNLVGELVARERKTQQILPQLHILSFPGQSPDAAEFQEVLKHALEGAGRHAESHFNMGLSGTHLDGMPWDGIIVQVNDLKNPPLLANGLFAIMKNMHLKVWSKAGSGYGTNDIVLWSHKPTYITNGDIEKIR